MFFCRVKLYSLPGGGAAALRRLAVFAERLKSESTSTFKQTQTVEKFACEKQLSPKQWHIHTRHDPQPSGAKSFVGKVFPALAKRRVFIRPRSRAPAGAERSASLVFFSRKQLPAKPSLLVGF